MSKISSTIHDLKEYEHLSNIDRMLQGYPYDLYTDELTTARNKSRNLIEEFNKTTTEQRSKRLELLKQILHPESNVKVYIKPNFRVDYGFNIKFGYNSYLNSDCCILDVAPVTIGKNFMAGPGVHIYTGSHPTGAMERRKYEIGKAVTIGDDVWLGGSAVICPGVTVGNGSVVGAGSVVTKDVPEYVLVAGNPARIIKHLEKPSEEELSGKASLGANNH